MSSSMPPMQQAREILAMLRLAGSKFSVEGDLLRRFEQTSGLKVALTTRKLSTHQGITGAAVQVGDALVILCPEGREALKALVIAHEVAHVVRGDPGLDKQAITQALDTSPDLPFVICDPEEELQAECTAAAIVVLARKPDSRKRRILGRIGAAFFGQAPEAADKSGDALNALTGFYDLDR